MAASLPRYEQTIEHKLKTLNAVTVVKINGFTGQLRRLTDRHVRTGQPGTLDEPAGTAGLPAGDGAAGVTPAGAGAGAEGGGEAPPPAVGPFGAAGTAPPASAAGG